MSKPGFHENKPWSEIDRFTDRDDLRATFRAKLHATGEPPVLMFYGIGGTGKTSLLKKLCEETPREVPRAFLDFAVESGGQRFVLDPALALQEIRQQLGIPVPRFDIALGMMRYKQGLGGEPSRYGEGIGLAMELAGEIAKKALDLVPGGKLAGASLVAGRLSKALWARVKDLPLGEFLSTQLGSEFTLQLLPRTSQEIGNALLDHLAGDLRSNLPVHFQRAARAVIFLDTYEAVSTGLQNDVHRQLREQPIRDFAANADFALMVIAGQNKLLWEEADAAWGSSLEQHAVGGLPEPHARRFLSLSGVEDAHLQAAILRTALEPDHGGYHCFSLELCALIVNVERRNGREPNPDTLVLRPQDWQALAARFLKSLATAEERFWIERLAVTPSFEEATARLACSPERSPAQDALWHALHRYSFIEPLAGRAGWFTVRAQMRWALENLPEARERIVKNHQLWRELWRNASRDPLDEMASLAWYHDYSLEPSRALQEWEKLAEAARTASPPRMREHFELLRWWEPAGLLEGHAASSDRAGLLALGVELWRASLGSRDANLRQAIACYEAALRVYTEADFPQDWAAAQNNFGLAWSDLPSGDRDANLRRAIACYEAALRVYTEADFPQDWAMTQNNLGNAWSNLPSGSRDANLRQAIACYEAALRVRTEADFPQDWAMTQNNLGAAWSNLPSGNRDANLRRAIACYEAALRVCTEADFPQDWAGTQNNLGAAWGNLPSGNRDANLRRAIACYEAALRVCTEADFPQDWATAQNNLGLAWSDLPSGNRDANLRRAIACYEAALRVYAEAEFPQNWATTQNNLGIAWGDLPSGNRDANLRRAIACYEAALRVCTEADFPQDWAMTQNNLGAAWKNLPSGDRDANLRRAIACYEAALRVRTEADFPQDWAGTQNNLGTAWWSLPSGDRDANLRRAIVCYEAALRVYTEADFPQDWAGTQNNLGNAWSNLPSGDRDANLRRAIACYEAALRVRTEADFPQDWAGTQNNLGIAWRSLPSGNRDANLRRAIACYEAALRVRIEADFPQDWAMTQNNLGNAWSDLPSGDRDANLRRAIACYEAALRVRTEADFPQDWAMTQNNLGLAWSDPPSGNRDANLRRAIVCYEAALRVYTEADFPHRNKIVRENLREIDPDR